MIKILFTYPIEVSNEAARIEEFMKDYDFLHIRKPDYSQEKMESLLEELSPELRARSVIHSHYYLLHKYDLKGINLNARVLPQIFDIDDTGSCEIQALIKSEDRILVNRQLAECVTYSAHSFEEIEGLNFESEYVFLSPVFDSISKEEYPSNFNNFDELRSDLEVCSRDVIALGGIKEEHEQLLEDAGFSGYAVLGSAWQNALIED